MYHDDDVPVLHFHPIPLPVPHFSYSAIGQAYKPAWPGPRYHTPKTTTHRHILPSRYDPSAVRLLKAIFMI